MTVEEEIVEITLRSLAVSGLATLLAAAAGIPLGLFLGLARSRGRDMLTGVFRGLMSMPTVALGLVLYVIFSRSGPLGVFRLLYTPLALVIGQALLVFPIGVSITAETCTALSSRVRELALTLGADERGATAAVVRESLGGIMLAVSASFSRAVSELGVALMVGGNLEGITRVLTTSIALETTRGEVVLGLALTVVLLSIMVVFNVVLRSAEQRIRWWLWQ